MSITSRAILSPVRIATTIEDGNYKMVKVRICRACPNVRGEGKDGWCELRGVTIDNLDTIIDPCPLPSLLEISKQIGQCTDLHARCEQMLALIKQNMIF